MRVCELGVLMILLSFLLINTSNTNLVILKSYTEGQRHSSDSPISMSDWPRLFGIYYNSSDSPEVRLAQDGNIIIGDHIVINATVPNLHGLPEFDIDHIQMFFLHGFRRTWMGDLVIPTSPNYPSGVIDLGDFAWVLVEDIQAGDDITLQLNFTNENSDVFAWWTDSDNSTWTVENNVLGTAMARGIEPEINVVKVNRSGSLMFGIYSADQGAGSYTLRVDTLVAYQVAEAMGCSATYDTYQVGYNKTVGIVVLAYDVSSKTYEFSLNSLTVNNFFSPQLSQIQVSRLESLYTINWSVYDRNQNESHRYDLLISFDDGNTFQLLKSNLTTQSYVWNASGYHSPNLIFEVRVRDETGLTDSQRSLSWQHSDPPLPYGNSISTSLPADITFTEGVTGNEIVWSLTVGEPLASTAGHYVKYRLFLDGEQTIEEIWETDELILVDLDGLASGEYNYTLYVWSSMGDVASDTVIVTVLISPFRSFLLAVTFGSLSVIAIITILFLKEVSKSKQ